MKELSSVSNPIVKAAAELKQKKYRTEQQAFLVEGMRSCKLWYSETAFCA